MNSRGDCLRGLGLRAALHAGGVVAGIFFVRVACTAQAELAARVLPRLPFTIPMETKLRQLLPNLGGGLFFELHPNPAAHHFRQAIRGGQLLMQKVQDLRRRQRAIGFPCLGINRQTMVFLVSA